MKNFNLLFLIIAVAITAVSCQKKASLEVINQTPCNYNMFQGSDSNGEYLGGVAGNSTVTFEIVLKKGLFSDILDDAGYCYAEASCNLLTYSDESFYVDLQKKKTSTILID